MIEKMAMGLVGFKWLRKTLTRKCKEYYVYTLVSWLMENLRTIELFFILLSLS